MELVTYEEAANMLGVPIGVLYHALEAGREVLTKIKSKGRSNFLIKEQVKLFVGNNPRTGHKKRLSFEALTTDERLAWQRYADEASRGYVMPGVPVVDEETITQIVRQELLRQEREDAERRANEAREKEERYLKDRPFLPRRERALSTV